MHRLAVFAILAVAGCCPLLPSGPAPAAAPPPGVPAPAVAAPRPGHATGHVLGADGKPITAKDARIIVSISGVSAAGANVGFSPAVGAEGIYDIELPAGNYRVSAQLQLIWNAEQFLLALDPVQDNHADRSANGGIVQDFVWKLSGRKPDCPEDPSNHTCWYGAGLHMGFQSYRNDLKKSVEQPRDGRKVIFTVTPKGPLADGSAAKTLTFERTYDKLLSGLSNGLLPDVPLGTYVVTGEEIAPDGSKRPLLIEKAYAEFGPSAEVTFHPWSTGGIAPTNMGFTRNAP